MSNFNFCKIILGGRLTADPELKTTPSGISVATFNIAVSRRHSKDEKTDFFSVTAWRGTAEFITRYFRKGNSICVEGVLENRTWTDERGITRNATNVVADEAHFVDSKSDTSGVALPPNAVPDAPKFEEISGDDEVPF